MSTDAPYFGIDFGTTNSSMSWYNPDTGRAEVIRSAEREYEVPSVVYFGEDELLVGKGAEEKLEEVEDSGDLEERDHVNQRIVRSIKRNLINPPVIPIPGREPVRPMEVVAEVLGKLKRDAEKEHFYEEIERVVITCPAIFGSREREVLLEAAAMAGFRRVELLEEPTAAAMAFSRLGRKVGKGVLVYDLGAGTFDLSVVAREEDGSFHVPMEPQGDPRCGGNDLDLALYYHCDEIAREKLERPISLTGEIDPVFLKQCRARKENLSLSNRSKSSSYLPSEDGPRRFRHEVDRETFEGLIRGRIEGTIKKTARLLEQAATRGHEIDTLVLIGGSSKVPLVERMLEEGITAEVRGFAERDYAVALGAAYHAFELWKKDEKAEEYRRALKICWQDRKLTATEVEWLANLSKQELKLSPEIAARVEREVMGETVESILERQEQLARERYCRVLKIGWAEKKLEALRGIPPARLDMLLDNQELFRDYDFADSPVSAAERKEMLGDTPWAEFTMAARVAADPDLSPAAVAERLGTIADELGLSEQQAASIEREVLGDSVEAALLQQEEQEEVRSLAQELGVDLSQVKGSGKSGRVTRQDVERYIEEQERKERERKERESREQARKEQERTERERKERREQEQRERRAPINLLHNRYL